MIPCSWLKSWTEERAAIVLQRINRHDSVSVQLLSPTTEQRCPRLHSFFQSATQSKIKSVTVLSWRVWSDLMVLWCHSCVFCWSWMSMYLWPMFPVIKPKSALCSSASCWALLYTIRWWTSGDEHQPSPEKKDLGRENRGEDKVNNGNYNGSLPENCISTQSSRNCIHPVAFLCLKVLVRFSIIPGHDIFRSCTTVRRQLDLLVFLNTNIIS